MRNLEVAIMSILICDSDLVLPYTMHLFATVLGHAMDH